MSSKKRWEQINFRADSETLEALDALVAVAAARKETAERSHLIRRAIRELAERWRVAPRRRTIVAKMTKREAARALRQILGRATATQAADVATILKLGAGHIGLPEGAVLAEPSELPAERRETWYALADGIRFSGPSGDDDNWDQPYIPTRAGQWESVLACLVLEEDWDNIARTAADLRITQEESVARPR